MLKYVVAIGLAVWPACAVYAQGKLETARGAMSRSSSSDSSNDSDTSSSDDGSRSTGHGGTPSFFLLYPYADNWPGAMWSEDFEVWDDPDVEPARPSIKGWSGRFSLDASNDFDGLNRFNAGLLLESSRGLGAETSWTHLYERLPGGGHDQMLLGDLNLTLGMHARYVQVRVGAGGRLATDRRQTHGGPNLTMGLDIYPFKPATLSTRVDVGTLGEAKVFHVRSTVGFLWKRLEFFTGYDSLRIGPVDLQGPVAGIRFWF